MIQSRRLLSVALLTAALLAAPRTAAAGPRAAEAPRLVVLVVVDQLRGDYLTRWGDLFGDDGFRRLTKDGAWFTNCHYPYADTWTAAGHSSVATGCTPATHGIIANEWYDRASATTLTSVSTERHSRVPPTMLGTDDREGKKARGVSPERLLAPTVGDALKEATGGRGRVVSLSLKDRSAVLPGGKRPDACYWMDAVGGRFVTSTYYRDRLHPWVEAFNRSAAADAWIGKPWERLRPELDYEKYSGPDDAEGEGTLLFGRTFPHSLGGGGAIQLRSAYYAALYNSPFGNDLLLAFARKAVEAEQLGRRDTPDLLCLSFSSNDPVGHCWGPDSQEVLDTTLRTDGIVRDLLALLDRQVGAGRYLLVLTADHGVCPLPEATRRRGGDALRIDRSPLVKQAAAFLTDTFHTPADETRWFDEEDGPWLYLNRGLLSRHHLKQAEVETALAGWLRKQPGIQDAVTRSRLLNHAPADDVERSVRLSFHPERSGDVRVITKPYCLLTTRLTGTNHGTAHPYDTHVPLLVYGAGVRPGVRREAVQPLAAAAILARGLGVKPPARASAGVPAGLFAGE